ncbi:MAG: TadE/TadG family type IV pilus assembly protein [Pseudomonadota bacterium]
MHRLRTWLRGAARDDEGSSTIPFVIFAPFFLMLVLSSVEMGVLMIRSVMLERAVDMSVRGLRLGTYQPPNHDTLKKDICNLAGIIPDCLNVLLVELRPVSTSTWQPLSSGPTCVDRAAPIQPVTEFNAGASDEMMLIRACAKFDPLFPTAGLGFSLPKDNTGAYALIAATAFVNEPAPGS